MRYINRTGIATPIGKIVKLDTDSKGVVLSQPADTDVLGVVTAMEGKIAIIEESGIKPVFIYNKFSKGDTVYVRKSNERGRDGDCYASADPTKPYLEIGVCAESGEKRIANVRMGIAYQVVGSLSGETDPIFVASAASGVTTGKISNWDTAYGWGNHPVHAYRAITALRTLDDTDYQINCTANSFTVTLPTAVGIQDKVYSIKNSGTGTITIACNGSQTIDGETTQSLSQWDNIVVMSNNANWVII